MLRTRGLSFQTLSVLNVCGDCATMILLAHNLCSTNVMAKHGTRSLSLHGQALMHYHQHNIARKILRPYASLSPLRRGVVCEGELRVITWAKFKTPSSSRLPFKILGTL